MPVRLSVFFWENQWVSLITFLYGIFKFKIPETVSKHMVHNQVVITMDKCLLWFIYNWLWAIDTILTCRSDASSCET